MERDGILIFHSIHKVMRAEKQLKDAGLDVRLMPVPRELSSDCGLSLSFRWSQWDEIEAQLAVAGCAPEERHRASDEGYRRERS